MRFGLRSPVLKHSSLLSFFHEFPPCVVFVWFFRQTPFNKQIKKKVQKTGSWFDFTRIPTCGRLDGPNWCLTVVQTPQEQRTGRLGWPLWSCGGVRILRDLSWRRKNIENIIKMVWHCVFFVELCFYLWFVRRKLLSSFLKRNIIFPFYLSNFWKSTVFVFRVFVGPFVKGGSVMYLFHASSSGAIERSRPDQLLEGPLGYSAAVQRRRPWYTLKVSKSGQICKYKPNLLLWLLFVASLTSFCGFFDFFLWLLCTLSIADWSTSSPETGPIVFTSRRVSAVSISAARQICRTCGCVSVPMVFAQVQEIPKREWRITMRSIYNESLHVWVYQIILNPFVHPSPYRGSVVWLEALKRPAAVHSLRHMSQLRTRIQVSTQYTAVFWNCLTKNVGSTLEFKLCFDTLFICIKYRCWKWVGLSLILILQAGLVFVPTSRSNPKSQRFRKHKGQ